MRIQCEKNRDFYKRMSTCRGVIPRCTNFQTLIFKDRNRRYQIGKKVKTSLCNFRITFSADLELECLFESKKSTRFIQNIVKIAKRR
jgi:hypothetical protein